MEEDRLIVAVGRLERALSRLETLDGPPPPAAADPALAEAHRRLRETTQAAIARIDTLLAAH